ncbi:MAG TPA: hypothetical protein VF173_31460 [Thermoanaerobaculia bacterium]|nr:hypothetical protein [Thermoanaerobaculia bacterium]
MSKSYRTQQPAAAAKRRIALDKEGAPVLPRIVERRPLPGDCHPVPAALLRRILKREVPLAYLLGLNRIELRPRSNNQIGKPFGQYRSSDKSIILYSLPLSWSWDFFPSVKLLAKMQNFFAKVDASPQGVQVTWPAREVLAMWFYIEVLGHELGHHYRWQNRVRRGGGGSQAHEEFMAEIHSHRFYQGFLKLMRRWKAQKD